MSSAGGRGRTRKVEFGAEDCASVAEQFGTCSMQDCENVLYFGTVGARAKDDWMAVVKDAVSVTKEKSEETGVKDGLEKSGDGDLRMLIFKISRDV